MPSLDLRSFWIGFLAAGILGFILQQIRLARNKMGAPDRPMTVKTEKTPTDVVRESRVAALDRVLWTVVFWLVSIGLLAYLIR